MTPETEVRALMAELETAPVDRALCYRAKTTLEALLAERPAVADAERDRVGEWLRLHGDCYEQLGNKCDRCPGCGRRNAAQALARNEHRSSEGKDDGQ